MSDLETASIEELFDAIKARCDSAVLAFSRKGKIKGDLGTFDSCFHGPSTHCAGLARYLTIWLDKDMLNAEDVDDA